MTIQIRCISYVTMCSRRCLCVGFSALAHHFITGFLDALQQLFFLLVIHAEVIDVIIILVENIGREVVVRLILLSKFILK